MKYRIVSYSVAVVALVGVLSLVLLSVPAAQDGAPATSAADVTPRLPNGHPDFTGFFNRDHFEGDPIEERPGEHVVTRTEDGSIFFNYAGANLPQLAATGQKPNQPPYKPEYMEKVKEIAATMYGGNTTLDPYYDCKPLGPVRAGLRIFQVVHSPDVMAILHEAAPGPAFRLIYTDGRAHPGPDVLDTSYMGHSIGHWEGDTLVVDTIGLNDETWLGGAQTGDQKYTSIHSDQLHVIERWTRTGNTITVNATVEDPVMFTRPWVMEPRKGTLAIPSEFIEPQMCLDVSKDHLIKPSAKDPNLICGWCNPVSVYGLEGDKVTNQDYVPPRRR